MALASPWGARHVLRSAAAATNCLCCAPQEELNELREQLQAAGDAQVRTGPFVMRGAVQSMRDATPSLAQRMLLSLLSPGVWPK